MEKLIDFIVGIIRALIGSGKSPKLEPAIHPLELTGVDYLRSIFARWGMPWVDDGVNILGIVDESNPGLYNDRTFAAIDGVLYDLGECTWEPGIHYTVKPMVRDGCAHLCKGPQIGIWRRGVHAPGTAFAHEALINWGAVKPVRYWRDGNKNSVQDIDEMEVITAVIATNFHRGDNYTNSGKDQIGVYSAGCPNVRSWEVFDKFIDAIDRSPYVQANKSAARFGALILDTGDVRLKNLSVV